MLANIKVIYVKFEVYWLMLLAFLLRVFGRGSSSYGVSGELYRDLSVVYNFLHLGQWPLLGPSSSLGGFYFGAVYYYITTPFVWVFNFAPYGATLVSLLASVLSLWMLYRLLRLWFPAEQNIARVAAFLLAVCAFDIQYSYYVSNPNLMPFFLLWFFYCLTFIISGFNKWKYYFGLGLAFGVATQLHATALLLLPLVLIGILFAKRKPNLSWRLLGFIMPVILLYLPNIVYEYQNSFSNTLSVLHLGQGNFGVLIKPSSVISIVMFLQSLVITRTALFDFFEEQFLAAVILFVIFLASLGWAVFWHRRNPQQENTITAEGKSIIKWWGIVGLLIFLFFQLPLQQFYFLVLWPLPLILLAWFVGSLIKRNALAAFVVMGIFSIIQVFQLWNFYPKTYITRFDHKNLLQDFAFVDENTERESFVIINDFADVNQFLYYLKLTGLDKKVTKSGASKMFMMCTPDDSCEVANGSYQRFLSEIKNGLIITGHKK